MFGLSVGLAGAAETAAGLNEGPICEMHPYGHGGTFRGFKPDSVLDAETLSIARKSNPPPVLTCALPCFVPSSALSALGRSGPPIGFVWG